MDKFSKTRAVIGRIDMGRYLLGLFLCLSPSMYMGHTDAILRFQGNEPSSTDLLNKNESYWQLH